MADDPSGTMNTASAPDPDPGGDPDTGGDPDMGGDLAAAIAFFLFSFFFFLFSFLILSHFIDQWA